MKKAILYIRVSTDEQADKGFSLKHQEERLRKYCETKGIEILDVYREDHSAKTFERPEFKKLLDFCKKNRGLVDYLLFLKWDRFSRNIRDSYNMINMLDKLGIESQSIEQPLDLSVPENKLMLAFYLASPEVENDRRSLNVFTGMRRAKKEGRWVASAPKGYRYTRDERNRPIIIPDKNSAYVKEAFEEMVKGINTQEEIRKSLNKRGFVCSRNNFNKMIKNPIYAGKILIPAFKDEDQVLIQGIHEPIIQETLFNEVQDIINGKRKCPTQYSKKEELPLRGYLECPRCGKRMTGSASRGKMGVRFFYYHCSKGCPERVRASQVNNDFTNLLKNISINSNVLELYAEILKEELKSLNKDVHKKMAKIQEEIKKNQERIDHAQQLMLDKELDVLDYKRIKTKYEESNYSLLKEKESLESSDENYTKYLDFSVQLLKKLDYYYDTATLGVKQQIVSSIYPEKLIYEKNKFRTPKVNKVVELIMLKDNELGGIKKGLKNKSANQSPRVRTRRVELLHQ